MAPSPLIPSQSRNSSLFSASGQHHRGGAALSSPSPFVLHGSTYSLPSSTPSPPRTAAARTRRLRPPLTARPPCTQPRSGTAAGSSSTYQQPRVALRAAQSSRRAVRHAGGQYYCPSSLFDPDLGELKVFVLVSKIPNLFLGVVEVERRIKR
ncbi:uncharacterized protein LOC107476808 isoform X2 [Arachis duranensis]|uniref:Uncharacterized protein LOC107476808 isoform X2 n=1 Tax=Arachis duranensis TaxID=130453 RepID=A0A6P4CL68_ARADU|nr:uncharacterized protein LOC107476808 isoform X2 [Arachis duranensis]